MSVVTNHQLFSHTYLARLQADPSHDEAAAPIGQGLRDWMPFRDTSSLQSLVDSWVGPVLDFLGFHHRPASDAPHIQLLYAQRGRETSVGLCYVVPPGQDGSTSSPHGLDNTTKGHHPMAQAVLAIRARDLRWGMLTDGARWRLVDARALRRYEHYVEVDLDGLAHSDDPTPLRLFYALFHRSAFTPDADVETGLDRLAAASARATKAAEDHLKARVSHNEGIMAQLCLGLVRADGHTRYTEPERDAIYRDATYLLYRVLFILYAEARGLLPIHNPAYRAVSLASLVETARDYKLRGMPDPQATTLWDRLKRLCTAIYESDPVLGIPAYNGGLFDDSDKPDLRDGRIADAYLTEALFDLVYRPGGDAPDGYQPLDYRDLSVRHLGSLYEGMIEYRLQIAEETLWARRDGKGNVRFLCTGQDGAPRKTDVEIEPGQVYFSQSPGERRATGTYYTPEYIVDYIVRQTVVRGLEERRAPLEEKLADWLEEIAAIQTSEVWETSEVSALQRAADEELLHFVEEQVLTFRACDMGMGSGHFLVNAGHQITNFIVETLHLTPWANSRVDADPVAWRRRAVERCLYGVDLSLMAVELAKLSLWLASVAEGKPLSFLDHHLRQGNSLIGARLEDLAEVLAGTAPARPSRRERKAREAGQLSMLEHPAFGQHVTAATDLLAQISARVAETVEDVKVQEADYEKVRAELEPYRQLAALVVALHFGVDVSEYRLHAIAEYSLNGAVGLVPEYQCLLTQTHELADERHFFHWELEFPEIFFDQQDPTASGVGFDAVIGNPPYLNAWAMTERMSSERAVIKGLFSQTELLEGHWDLYVPFIVRSLEICRSKGYHSFIVPNPFLREKYAVSLRKHLLSFHSMRSILSFGETNVFDEVSRQSTVYVVRVDSNEERQQSIRLATDVKPLTYQSTVVDSAVWLEAYNYQIRVNEDYVKGLPILEKIEEHSDLLGQYLYVNVGATVSSKEPGAFAKNNVIGGVPQGNAKKFFDGTSLSRWNITWKQVWLDYRRDEMSGPRTPEMFESAKLLVRIRTAENERLISAYDDTGMYCDHTVIVCCDYEALEGSTAQTEFQGFEKRDVLLDHLYMLSLLNSLLVSWVFQNKFATGTLQGSFSDVWPQSVRSFPIRRIEFITPAGTRATLLEKGQHLYNICVDKDDQDHVIGFVQHQISQQPERADVVHDLLAYLAQQMIDLHKERRRLEREAKLFRFVERETPCLRLDKALSGPLGAGEMVGDLSTIRHDIEGLRLNQEEDGRWLLEVRAKLRDPESGWREHQRDRDGNFIRQWLPVYRLPLDEPTGRFYHYAFAHLRGFDGAGQFPGGYTRTTLEKLNATKVPRFVPVDLAPLAALEAELAETQRKIRLTDDLIDQIVYKLYGLTEEEIAIVEGRLEHE